MYTVCVYHVCHCEDCGLDFCDLLVQQSITLGLGCFIILFGNLPTKDYQVFNPLFEQHSTSEVLFIILTLLSVSYFQNCPFLYVCLRKNSN